MKNEIYLDPEYADVSRMLNVIGLLKIYLSSDSSKNYALQGFIVQKRLLNFRQVNRMSLADYHRKFEMLGKVALEAGLDFVTMDWMEHKRKIVYPITLASFLTDH